MQILAVDWRREGFVQFVQIAGLDRVSFMLVGADALADRRVAGLHEFDEESGGLCDVVALIGEGAEKVSHLREDAFDKFAEDRRVGLVGVVIHGGSVHGLQVPR